MKAGDCFFTPEAGPHGRHLWIVASDPDKSASVAIANFSTKPYRNGEKCAVSAGSHRNLTQHSYVRCELARIEARASLEAVIASGTFRTAQDANPELLQQVRGILLACPLTRRGIQKLLRDQAVPPEEESPTQ